MGFDKVTMIDTSAEGDLSHIRFNDSGMLVSVMMETFQLSRGWLKEEASANMPAMRWRWTK